MRRSGQRAHHAWAHQPTGLDPWFLATHGQDQGEPQVPRRGPAMSGAQAARYHLASREPLPQGAHRDLPRGQCRWPAAVAFVAVSLFVTACGGTPPAAVAPSGPPTDAALPPAPTPAPIAWVPCPKSPTLQCGSVRVPLDYAHPTGTSIAIAVTRAPAAHPAPDDPTLVFNPGGPGESGNQILPVFLSLVPPAVRAHFSIVSFDPRGTGASDPLDCGTSPSAVTSALPVPAAAGLPLPASTVFTPMAAACQARAGSLEPFIDTVNTARDMDRIREALGLQRISYYGISYGTVLGAVYADLFPHRVATMVLDGAVDVNASLTVQAEEQAPAAERSMDHLLATCGGEAPCPLGHDPRSSFTALAAALARHPLPAPGNGDDHPVTVGDLDTATLFALSVPAFVPSYLQALEAARAGEGAPLRQLALELVTDIDGAPLVDAQWAITCNDAATHPGPVAAGALARSLAARYPLIGGFGATYALGGCVSWPAARQPVEDLHPSGTPPILVIGNTGDPNTPLVGAVHLAAAFSDARLLTWQGFGHTWILSGSGDTCMQNWVGRYLLGSGPPPAGTVCN